MDYVDHVVDGVILLDPLIVETLRRRLRCLWRLLLYTSLLDDIPEVIEVYGWLLLETFEDGASACVF